MGSALAFLLQHKSLVIIMLLLVALAGFGVYAKVLSSEVGECRAKQHELQAKLEISQASVLSLQEAINDQNKAIEKLGTAAAERQLANAVALNQAKETSNVYKKQAADLMKVQRLPGVTSCDSANQLVNREIQGAK